MSTAVYNRFKSVQVYKDLVFSVFNMTNVENMVKAKYNTKNNINDGRLVFLPIKNHNNANRISRINFRPTDISKKIIRLSGSVFWPIKKIKRIISVITEKSNKRSVNPNRVIPVFKRGSKKNAAKNIRISSIRRNIKYFLKFFN
jgi:hypothetical protein